mmetsp:Transcript_31982/g.66189  ORF Transcript_31982/g.66189 Transcript_31982/m.66189 type:complete len:254 (+) Transcript_31982:80-841(+)
MAKPQLIPAVIVWVKILWRYEGLHETLDCNLIGDINDIATLGIGPTKEPIQQVNKKLELLFSPAMKTFTTAEELCDHLRVCVLTSIIRDSAKGTSNASKAWTLANNTVISTTRMNTPVTMAIVMNAISLAQKHLDKMEEEEPTPSFPVDVPEVPPAATGSVSALKAHIAEQQRTLAVMQGAKPKEGARETGGGEKRKRDFRGGKAKGGDRAAWNFGRRAAAAARSTRENLRRIIATRGPRHPWRPRRPKSMHC